MVEIRIIKTGAVIAVPAREARRSIARGTDVQVRPSGKGQLIAPANRMRQPGAVR